jgi:hypothetical protein
MILLSAQGMSPVKIADVTFTSEDRVRDLIHNFNADGFASLYPKYAGGRTRKFTLPERLEIKKIAKSRPPGTACRSRPGAWRSSRTSWSPRGWSTPPNSTRASTTSSPPVGRISADRAGRKTGVEPTAAYYGSPIRPYGRLLLLRCRASRRSKILSKIRRCHERSDGS